MHAIQLHMLNIMYCVLHLTTKLKLLQLVERFALQCIYSIRAIVESIHFVSWQSPLLFILSIEVSSESVEDSGNQMTPKLENKALSVESTQHIRLKHHMEHYNTSFETYKQGM